MRLTSPLARTAALTACLLPLAAWAQYSTPMRNVENPDRFPYQESVSASLDPPFVNGFAFLPTPLGKRYVIEYIALICTTPSASDTFPQQYLSVSKTVSSTSSTSSSIVLAPMVRTGSSFFGGYVWTSQTQLKAYSDPSIFSADGSGAMLLNLFHSDTSVRASCNATVVGHTITP